VPAQNRVDLSTTLPPDEHGAIPRVTFKHRARSERTRTNREFLAGEAARLLKAAGAKEIYRIGWPPLILHVQSTMRMGEDPANSVLDPNAESRAVKGLFVADNSALANGLRSFSSTSTGPGGSRARPPWCPPPGRSRARSSRAVSDQPRAASSPVKTSVAAARWWRRRSSTWVSARWARSSTRSESIRGSAEAI